MSTYDTSWRYQLQRNQRRSMIVISLFLAIYIGLGLLIDSLFVMNEYHCTLTQAINLLWNQQVPPLATLILGGIAVISLLVTFVLHDKLMLLGTHYREVTQQSTHPEEQQLFNIVEELKIAAGLHYMPKIYIIDAPYMNAFASGYSEKSALIAITQGLLEKLDRSETQAVMAHELSHIRHLDIKLTLMASVLSNILLIVIDLLFRGVIYGGNYTESGRKHRGGNGGVLGLAIILLRFVLPIITLLLILYLSRTREYMADAGAVELMRDNEPLSRALLKIEADYRNQNYQSVAKTTAHEDIRRAAYIFDPDKAGLLSHLSFTSLFSTHPSISDRLKALGFSKG